jgi:hypothetical protein
MAITPISADLLVSISQARMAQRGFAPSSSGAAQTAAVKAPWESSSTLTPANTLVSNALSGRAIFDASTKKFSTPGLSADGRKLFALHAGVNTLAALASRYEQDGVSDSEKARLANAFSSGMKQLESFLAGAKFAGVEIVRGALQNTAISKALVASAPTSYTTGVVARGDPSVANDAFAGDIAFTIDAENADGDPVQVQIDLADMGATPRSLNSVVAFLNQKLGAAGLTSRFETVLQKDKSSNGQEQYALKIRIGSSETLGFSAATTAPALYVTGGEGRLIKFQDTDGSAAPPPLPGDAGWQPGRVYDKALQQGDTRASAVGADGSLYVLADVTSPTNQPSKGATDVAVFKYDSAGNLVYTRTLGAAQDGQGFSLAVGADGRVAISGAVTGGLTQVSTDAGVTTVSTGSTVTGADSFVTVFNADGEEVWTARDNASGDDEARALVFADDGTLYVGGRTKGTLAGQVSQGGWDAYLRSYDADGALVSTTQYGGAGDDDVGAIALEDLGGGVRRVTLAGAEAGKLVLRQFTDDGVSVTAGTTRDLGALGGGDVVGLAIDGGELYIAGNTTIGGLNAGSVASAYGGGKDGFVAKLATDLAAGGGDRISYIGGASDDSIAGFAVSGGQVWVGGDAKSAFNGDLAIGTRDGFVGRLEADGTIGWTQRFSEKDQDFSATSFAFDVGGASALDRLGLPSGVIDLKDSKLVTARTSLRAGDEFSISVNGRSAQKIVIKADDTMTTLADRIEKILLSDGAATATIAGGEGIKITASSGDKITLINGPVGKNALAGLGLSEGVVKPELTATQKKKAKPSYGLGIASSYDLSSKLDRKNATDNFGAALSAIQKAYKELTNPTPTTPTGPVPEYLSAQIANYQAALARLGGGG